MDRYHGALHIQGEATLFEVDISEPLHDGGWRSNPIAAHFTRCRTGRTLIRNPRRHCRGLKSSHAECRLYTSRFIDRRRAAPSKQTRFGSGRRSQPLTRGRSVFLRRVEEQPRLQRSAQPRHTGPLLAFNPVSECACHLWFYAKSECLDTDGTAKQRANATMPR
jgi:hypothetical protein